ncbi:MAG TPA: helix-turn-helix domain-containing protein [Tissierellaceae bacterium]|nr:helix-turn-helix domain-containing protein [Tissierellaceae bacterium]
MTLCKELDSKSIGKRIRTQREKLGLSRDNLAKIVNLSTYYIGQIERGERNMSIQTLYNISESLNISMDYIVKGKVKYTKDMLVLESLENNYQQIPNNDIKGVIDLLSDSSPNYVTLVKDMMKLILPYVN